MKKVLFFDGAAVEAKKEDFDEELETWAKRGSPPVWTARRRQKKTRVVERKRKKRKKRKAKRKRKAMETREAIRSSWRSEEAGTSLKEEKGQGIQKIEERQRKESKKRRREEKRREDKADESTVARELNE